MVGVVCILVIHLKKYQFSTHYLDKAFPLPPMVAALATEEPPSRLTVFAIASPFSANELELALLLNLGGPGAAVGFVAAVDEVAGFAVDDALSPSSSSPSIGCPSGPL